MARGDSAELTLRAVALGLGLGALLAAGNVYAGLKLGVMDSGGLTVILLSTALCRAAGRSLTPREVNVAQVTGASAATMALTAGLAGPIPALAMSGQRPGVGWILLWGGALAVLGTLLAVPFRRQLIEEERLPFPSGRASAELISGLARGGERARVGVLFGAIAAAAVFTVARERLGWIPASALLPGSAFGVALAALGVGLNMSPLVAGVGVLVGARTGVSVLLGGVAAWVVVTPALASAGAIGGVDFGSAIQWLLWPGAALMVSSSLTSLALGARELLRGWTSRRADGGRSARRSQLGGLAAAVVVIAVGWVGFGVAPWIGALAIALAVVFSIVGMRATGQTDQTPAGPLGGLTQVLVGAGAPGGTAEPLFAGGVVNGAAGHSSQMQQSWRAGHLLGSSPGRLLVAQMSGIAVGALAAAASYFLLDATYGVGSAELPSPPALSWKATADLVSAGVGAMPGGALEAALIAALAGAVLTWLERTRAARFTPSPVALGIGFMVPASIAATIAAGGLLTAAARARWPASIDRHGPALASGLITGEALTFLVLAAIELARSG